MNALFEAGLDLLLDGQWPKALESFHLAVDLGHDRALAYLSHCYKRGWGTKINERKSSVYTHMGAKRGDVLCLCFQLRCETQFHGDAREPDERERLIFALLSQEAKICQDPLIWHVLGMCYLTGQGVRKDRKQAINWLTKAAQRGLASSRAELGEQLYLDDDSKRMGKEWIRMASDTGDAEGQWMDSEYNKKSYDCDFCPKSRSKEIEMLRKAADQGHTSSIRYLALQDQRNQDTLCFLAKQGDDVSQWMMGTRLNSSPDPKTKTESLYWLEKAAAVGFLDAANFLK